MNTRELTDEQLAELQAEIKQICGEEFTTEQVSAFFTISERLRHAAISKMEKEAQESAETEEKQ